MRQVLVPVLIATLVLAVVVVTWISSRDASEITDYDLARSRALLETDNLVAALEVVSQVAAEHPDSGPARLLLGVARLRMHLYQSAIDEFQAAAALISGQADAQIGLAYAYLALGRIGEAATAAQLATELNPASVEAWGVLANARWREKSYADAETAALRARQMEPDDPQALEALLHIYMDQGKPEQFGALIDQVPRENDSLKELVVRFLVRESQFARAWAFKSEAERRSRELSVLGAELALARSPDRIDVYPQLIRDLVAIGAYERAIQYGAAYRGTEPVAMEIGKAFWLAGELEQAAGYFEEAARNGLHALSAQVALAIIDGQMEHWTRAFQAEHAERDYFILGKLEPLARDATGSLEAMIWRYLGIYDPVFYNRAVEVGVDLEGPDASELNVLLTMGTAYERLGRFEEAERYLGRARDLYPTTAEPRARLAMLAIRHGDTARVLGMMEEAVSLDPEDPANLFNLGWMYDQIDDDERAADFYRRSIESSPLSFDAMNNLALIHMQRGDDQQALELLEGAIRAGPTSEATHHNLAEHYINQNDWRPALASLDRVLAINPYNTTALVEQARIEMTLGNPENALNRLNVALGLNPSLFEAYMLASSAYERLGYPGAALGAADEAARIRPDDLELLRTVKRLQEVYE